MTVPIPLLAKTGFGTGDLVIVNHYADAVGSARWRCAVLLLRRRWHKCADRHAKTQRSAAARGIRT